MAGLIPIGKPQLASDVTTAGVIEQPGSHSQRAVDDRISLVAADIVASDPTVAAAAAAAVGAVADARYPSASGPVLLLPNADFDVEPVAANTPTPDNWYNVSTPKTWESITDGPNGAAKVIRILGAGQSIAGRMVDLVTRGLAGKTITLRIRARALVNGAAVTCPLRVLALNASSVTFADVRIEPISTQWAWQTVDITLPAGNAIVSFAIGTHPGAPAGSTRAELDRIEAFVKGGSVVVSAQAAATQAGAPVAWTPNTAYRVHQRVVTEAGDELKCVTAHTSGPLLTWHLPNWVPVAAPTNEQMLLGKARTARGGSIGVGSKPVFAIRFDDWHNAFKADVLAMLTARGLPAGFASVSDLTSNVWVTGTTSAEIASWNRQGVEIHSHGLDHMDPTPGGVAGPAGLFAQIVASKATIESWGVKCQGWMQPGASPRVAGVTPYGTTFTDLSSLDGYAQWLIRNTYPVSETDAWGGNGRTVPHYLFHGAAHITISDGLALSATMAALEETLANGGALEMMIHAGNLGVGSNLTLAQLAGILDWLVARRDEGKIEVLTPSGLFFADRGTTRLDLIRDGSFEDTPSAWGGLTGGTTVRTTGGRTGANFLHIPAANAGMVTQTRARLTERGHDGQTFLFEGWARSSAGAVPRVTLTAGPLTADLTRPAVGTGWTPVRHAFTVPPGQATLAAGIGRASGGEIEWDDVAIHAV